MKRLNSRGKVHVSKIVHFINIANIFVVGLLILLPFFLFDGRLFLGGDDTRFYMVYPREILNSFTLYSWNNISSLPYYIPNHYWLPFVFVGSVIDSILNSKLILSYFSFSAVLVLGFIYFQKFIRQLIGEEYSIAFVTGLIYLLSPITLVSLSFFLAPVWLIALVPIVAYYYICYLRWGKIVDIIKVVAWSILLSFVFFSIPWILGLLLPLFLGMIFFLIFVENPFKSLLKRSLIFVFFIISSQLFWLIPFAASLVSGGQTSLGQKIVSTDLATSYRNTILSTATDNIVYPLLTMYHRRMVFEFGWHLKDIFLNYFDHVLPLSAIFPVVLLLGIIKYNRVFEIGKKKMFIFLLASFISVLYLCTVNVGFLKNVFILLGYLPGFAVLRNFTDKFALAFIFIYATLLSFCFLAIKKSYKLYAITLLATLAVVLINFVPVKRMISAPLWKTNNTYTTVNLPKEYISFIKKTKLTIPSTTNIIALPQNITAYSIITEDNGRNAYVGTSPLKFFTGINDLTGTDSYPSFISQEIQRLIVKRDYSNLLTLFTQINAGYLMVTNNAPREVKDSYLYDRDYLKFQDKQLIDSIVEREVVRSSKGNYVIYKLKNSSSIISSGARLEYKKISPVDYEIKLSSLSGNKDLFFKETYHRGWSLYVAKKNQNHESSDFKFDFLLPLSKPVFTASHVGQLPYGNKWVINGDVIKNDFAKDYYTENKDGSIDVKLHLYFAPQFNFYIGSIMSFIFMIVGGLYLWKLDKKQNEK